jgi:hypothetical protein
MKYDYYEAVKEDIKNYLQDNYTIEEVKEFKEDNSDLYDTLFLEDDITGNASGSYTFNTWKAEENISHNWDLIEEMLDYFGETDVNISEKGAEWLDVSIRCYVLGQVLEDAISEYLEEV